MVSHGFKVVQDFVHPQYDYWDTSPYRCQSAWSLRPSCFSLASLLPQEAKKSHFSLLLDPECFLLAGALGLYEFMTYPPMNSVAILFMKERTEKDVLPARIWLSLECDDHQ